MERIQKKTTRESNEATINIIRKRVYYFSYIFLAKEHYYEETGNQKRI